MSHEATNWAIKQRGLKPTTKIVLWHLCDRFNPDYGCFPSQDRLAHDCEISRSTLNDHLAQLEAVGLLRESVDGLMDRSLDTDSVARVQGVLDAYQARGVRYRGLRTRRAGASSFLQVVVLVPGDWSVRQGHDLLDEIEAELESAIPGLEVSTHLEPLP